MSFVPLISARTPLRPVGRAPMVLVACLLGCGPGVLTDAPDQSQLVSYVYPQFCYESASSCSEALKGGFELAIDGERHSVTDRDGRFELWLVTNTQHQLTISKRWYLPRSISLLLSGDNVRSPEDPITIWAGDLNEDGVVDTRDGEQIAAANGATTTPPEYAREDVNCDGAVNMQDLRALEKGFNKNAGDYPVFAIR